MIKIMIIADDLTGAADTGVKFTACGPVRLINAGFSLASAGKGDRPSSPQSPEIGLDEILAVNTETRNVPADKVPGALAQAIAYGGRPLPDLIYKKIDSCLRGHVGLELSCLLESRPYKAALVAPAYPAFNRITKESLHYIDGRPVSETELARDPLRPVKDSNLNRVISEGHNLPVHSLRLGDVRQGPEALALKIKHLLNKSERCLFAVDSETDEDLDLVAEAGLMVGGLEPAQPQPGQNEATSPPPGRPIAPAGVPALILAGSAGLAEALCRRLGPGEQGPRGVPPNHQASQAEAMLRLRKNLKGPLIFFGGSASEVLRSQLNYLAEDCGADILTLDPAELLAGEERCPVRLSDGETLVVNLPRPEDRPVYSSLDLIAAFGRRTAGLIRELKPKAVFLSGGDTARAALEALGIEQMLIKAELRPGVVLLSHGDLDIVTKSGTFGRISLLGEIRQMLANK